MKNDIYKLLLEVEEQRHIEYSDLVDRINKGVISVIILNVIFILILGIIILR